MKQSPRVRVGVSEGEDKLCRSRQSSRAAARRGRFCAKWILGHVTQAKLLSHPAEPSKSHFAHLLLPQSNPSENRGQDSQELCWENKVLAGYARGDREKIWAHSKTLWDNTRGPPKCWDEKTDFISWRRFFKNLDYSLPIQFSHLEYFLFSKALFKLWTIKAKATLVSSGRLEFKQIIPFP